MYGLSIYICVYLVFVTTMIDDGQEDGGVGWKGAGRHCRWDKTRKSHIIIAGAADKRGPWGCLHVGAKTGYEFNQVGLCHDCLM
jgi:hypothetical protein